MNFENILQILAIIGVVVPLVLDVSIKNNLLKELNYTGLFPLVTDKYYEQPAEISSIISKDNCQDKIRISTGEVSVFLSPEKLKVELLEANSKTLYEVNPFGFNLEVQFVNITCKLINNIEKIELSAQNAFGKISKIIQNGTEIYSCEGKCNNWKLTNSSEFCKNIIYEKKREIEKAIRLSQCFK